MLSNHTSLLVNAKIFHAPPRLMFYAPCATDKGIGSPPPGVNMPRVPRAGPPDARIMSFQNLQSIPDARGTDFFSFLQFANRRRFPHH